MPEGPATDSSGSKALYAMGVVTRLAGDPAAALRLQRLALAATAGARAAALRRMRGLTEIGFSLLDLGKPGEAAHSLQHALALSRQEQTQTAPDRADILLALGRTQHALGRPAEARRLLAEADAFWRDFDRHSRDANDAARWLARAEDLLHSSASAP